MRTPHKARIFSQYFGMYGKGNFDLTYSDINIVFFILNKKNPEEIDKLLKEFYESIQKERLG